MILCAYVYIYIYIKQSKHRLHRFILHTSPKFPDLAMS